MVMSRSSHPRSMAPKPAPKMSKAAADYVATAPGEDRCGTCQMFRPLDNCTAVEGRISPRAVCRLYESALDHFQGEMDARAERRREQESPFAASPADE